ncbi:MAG: hypothetical protein M3167_10100 [Acidobacteriota bacterium]|nr:hypothetical protein [Acidobacteriota bacterium]
MSHVALCTYRVRPGQEKAFLTLLRRHRPALLKYDLVTDDHHDIFRGKDHDAKPFFVEILSWRSPEGPMLAEQLPDVIRVWEAMGKLCEARGGRPPMEFPFVDVLTPE